MQSSGPENHPRKRRGGNGLAAEGVVALKRGDDGSPAHFFRPRGELLGASDSFVELLEDVREGCRLRPVGCGYLIEEGTHRLHGRLRVDPWVPLPEELDVGLEVRLSRRDLLDRRAVLECIPSRLVLAL